MSWRSLGLTVVLAIAGLAGAAGTAQAQLFPNLTIRRQRVEKPLEPPFYSQVRQNYYGYYPTCWQKFPEGWACPCPNPEAPDLAEAFRKRPRDDKSLLPPPEDDLGPLPEDDGAGPRRNGPAPLDENKGRAPSNVPPIPNGTRSPFELDTRKPTDTPSDNPDLPTPSDAGRMRNAPPRGSETPPPAGAAPTPPGGTNRPTLPGGVDPFAPPTSSNRDASGLPEISMAGPSNPVLASRGRPLLEMPDMPAASAPGSNDVVSIQPFPASLPTNGNAVDAPAAHSNEPATAPKRPSLLGGIFNNMNNRRRR